MVEKTFGVMKDLKVGKYVLIDEEPCRVVNVQTSAPGKHGHAKIRVDAIGVFDGVKRILMKPSDGTIEIPIIERKTGQIITLVGKNATIMDLETFENFDIEITDDLIADAEAGREVEYIAAMGKRMITRIKKG